MYWTWEFATERMDQHWSPIELESVKWRVVSRVLWTNPRSSRISKIQGWLLSRQISSVTVGNNRCSNFWTWPIGTSRTSCLTAGSLVGKALLLRKWCLASIVRLCVCCGINLLLLACLAIPCSDLVLRASAKWLGQLSWSNLMEKSLSLWKPSMGDACRSGLHIVQRKLTSMA